MEETADYQTNNDSQEEIIEEKITEKPKPRKAVLPELKDPFNEINEAVRAIRGLNIENFTPRTKPMDVPVAIYDAVQKIAAMFGEIDNSPFPIKKEIEEAMNQMYNDLLDKHSCKDGCYYDNISTCSQETNG